MDSAPDTYKRIRRTIGFIRLWGWLFTLGASVFVVFGVFLLFDPQATVTVNGVPRMDFLAKLTFTLIALVSIGIGLFFALAPKSWFVKFILYQEDQQRRLIALLPSPLKKLFGANLSSSSVPPVLSPRPHLNLVVLRSPNIERAALFYTRLGINFTRHSHGNGPEHYASEASGTVFEIYPATATHPSTASTRIGFRVQSVDDVVPLLQTMGAELTTPPHDSDWGRRAVIKDPDGHTLELLTPKTS